MVKFNSKFCWKYNYCKYRDKRGTVCPHGCAAHITVCHKWDRGQCKHSANCWFGLHERPTAPPEPKAKARPRPRATQQPKVRLRPAVKKVGATDAEDVEAATEAMLKLLMKEKRDDATCKHLLLALHPDKVQGLKFQCVFEELTKKINAFREKL